MSHFSTIRTQLVDEQTLRTALGRLGFRVDPPGPGAEGFAGRRAQVQFKIRPGRSTHEIGFARSSSGYEVVADWWGLPDIDRETFVRQLVQQYALVGTLETLTARGFQVDEQVEDSAGEIHLLLRRTVGL